jgi:hypothetical protein
VEAHHRVVMRDPIAGAASIRSRLHASKNGTCDSRALGGRQRYQNGARVPAGEWRELVDSEFALLTGPQASQPGVHTEQCAVFVLRLPDDLVRHFAHIQDINARFPTVATVRRYASGQRVAELGTTMRSLATAWVSSIDGLDAQGINVSETSLQTTTLACPPDRTFVGLHCDSFGGRTVPIPTIDPTRMCINIGSEDRYFLFADVLVHSALSISSMTDSASAFRAKYLTDNPARPIYRLTLHPGEAYLAPTANLIHDATTVGKRAIDVTYGLVGQFRVERILAAWSM